MLYGSSSGLTADGDQWWDQDVPGVAGSAEPGDRFGAALGTGDFDGDGSADLAIGVPWEDLGSFFDAGGIHVSRGTTAGLTAAESRWWDQSSPGVLGDIWYADQFGEAFGELVGHHVS